MRTKTQQGTDKAGEHNGRTVFPRALVLLARTSAGVVSTSSYHLSSLYFTSSQFAPTSLFVSAFATDRVRRPLGSGGLTISYDRVSPRPSMRPI